jgi:hypothetical protein
MDKLKSLWAKFKVQISFVAGCLVVATSMGTCSFDPSATSEEAETETTPVSVETVETSDVVETVEAINAAATGDLETLTEGDTELNDNTVSSEATE